MRRVALLKSSVGLILCVGAIALVRDTRYQGQDFEVFWRAADNVLSGRPAYDVARDGAMVFKYPPWIVPAFFPFALFPLTAAKWLWGVGQVLCLAWILSWLRANGCRPLTMLTALVSFWGIWVVHALDGQITLLMTALGLAAFPGDTVKRAGAGIWALSTKVFTLVSAVGFLSSKRAHLFSLKKLAALIAVFVTLSMPAIWVSKGRSLEGTLRSWEAAAVSGGVAFEGAKIRGRDNQGLPAFALRLAGVSAERADKDVLISLVLASVLGAFWYLFSIGLAETERWVGWLALGAIVHPLAWFHLFVLAFPLAVVALDRTWKRKRRLPRLLSALGVAMLSLISAKTLGDIGAWFEFGSIKSWGVVACAIALIISARLETKTKDVSRA